MTTTAAAARGPRPLKAFLVSLSLSAVALLLLLLSDSRVLELRRARADIRRLEAEIAEKTKEQEALRASIAASEKDSFPAEKVAREELNLVDPGDLVLLFPEGSLTKPQGALAAITPVPTPLPTPTKKPRS
ncbi:MAG TPA: septum formation initiator family protein [Thermoanaerobaculia bacterium]|jgi:cell division protein FtsB